MAFIPKNPTTGRIESLAAGMAREEAAKIAAFQGSLPSMSQVIAGGMSHDPATGQFEAMATKLPEVNKSLDAMTQAGDRVSKSLFHISTRMYGMAGITAAFAAASRAVSAWAESSKRSMAYMEESSRQWATMHGAGSTSDERLAAAYAALAGAQRAYEAAGGSQGAPSMWGGEKFGNWIRESLGIDTPGKTLRNAAYEVSAAEARVALFEKAAKGKTAGFVGGFSDFGRELQRGLLETETLELTRAIKDSAEHIDTVLTKNLGSEGDGGGSAWQRKQRAVLSYLNAGGVVQ